MVKLIVFKFYINSEAGIVLCLFLIFGNFEPRCSYEIALIKKKSVYGRRRNRPNIHLCFHQWRGGRGARGQ